MYSTYEEYCAQGGSMTPECYDALARQAAAIIDREIMGRAASAPAEMLEPLAACECALIGQLAGGHLGAGGVSSFTTDGYSETFSDAKETRAALRELVGQYLTFPVDLLHYAGRAFV